MTLRERMKVKILHKMETMFTKQIGMIMKTLESFAQKYSLQCSQIIQAQHTMVEAQSNICQITTPLTNTFKSLPSNSNSEPSTVTILC